MAALFGVLRSIIFQLILSIQMAAQVRVKYFTIYLVKFDSPDGSTFWDHKYYNNLVNSGLPDGSTS